MTTGDFSTLLLWLGAYTVILVDVLLVAGGIGSSSPPQARWRWLLIPSTFAILALMLTPQRWFALGLIALVVAVHATRHLLWLRRARQTLDPAPAALVTKVEELCHRWQVQPPVYVRIDRTAPASPAVAGLWHHTLILPDIQRAPSDQADLEAILAHELAHVHRRDPLRVWLLGVLRSLLGWHPLARRTLDHLELEIELEADRQAVAWLRDARTYARSLVRWAERVAAVPGRPAAAARLAVPGGALFIRLRVLLDPESPAPHLSLPGILTTLGQRPGRRPAWDVLGYIALPYQLLSLSLFAIATRLW